MNSERKYGLITSITMVIGIVIGSGIFFKTDDILSKTNGSVVLGVIAWIVGALGIIFGGLTIAQIAMKDDKAGGIITYSEKGYGEKFGYYVGIFQVLVYYPCLGAIISYVAGIYSGILFGFEINSITHWAVSLGYLVLLYAINILTQKSGGYIQNAATFIKAIPLILLAILGVIFGKSGAIDFSSIPSLTSVGVLVAIAFSFDGWIVSTSICHEVKNAKRNLPLALTIAPLIILGIYLLYYLGICNLVSPQEIIELGDAHVAKAASILLGESSYKYILIAIVISVLGTVNGLVLGAVRLPYSLGLRNQVPGSKWLSKLNSKTNMPVNSGIVALIPTLFWFAFHFLTTKIAALSTFDISALPIILNYVIYIALYVYVIRLTKKGEVKGVMKGYIVPVLAIVGALLVVYGGFMDKNILAYIAVTIVALVIGYFVRNKKTV